MVRAGKHGNSIGGREPALRVLSRFRSYVRPTSHRRGGSPSIEEPVPMEYSQVVRHRFLVSACKGSNPFTPDYEHPIESVKNELTTTGEAAD
ncbi:hypothetical protein MLD38_040517 [Melastoma candidum]|nr:hypothetical protein MLD38_040517 [Melastoma candidum]